MLVLSLTQHQNQLILGVMGIDVSLDDIKKLTPRFTVSLTPMCDHMHAGKYIYQTKSCDLLSCEELAPSFPSGAISE